MIRTDVTAICLALALVACTHGRPPDPASAGSETCESAVSETQAPELAPDATAVDSAQRRIVSLTGGITEILYVLGVGDDVVAVDASTFYPPQAMQLPRVGYHRALATEGVLALEPTLMLGSSGDGPDSVVRQLDAAIEDYRRFEEPSSIEQGLERIVLIGDAVGRQEEAASLVARLGAELDSLEGAASASQTRALFLYARGPGNLFIGGHGTGIDAVFAHLGIQNAAGDAVDFVTFTPEAALAANPDVIVLPERGLQSIGGAEGLLAIPGLSATPAGQNGRVIAVDDAALLNYGPRLPEGMRSLLAALQGQDT